MYLEINVFSIVLYKDESETSETREEAFSILQNKLWLS